MSASPNPFARAARRNKNKHGIQAPTSFNRVTEPDESVFETPANKEEVNATKLDNLPYTAPQISGKRWTVYFASWMLVSLLAGLIAGRMLYLLRERVALHDQQLSSQQTSIQNLMRTQTTVSDQASHLKALDTNVETLQALLDAQSKRLDALENGQVGIRDQLNGMNTRWQKQINELHKDKVPAVSASVPKAESSVPAKTPSAPQIQPASDKHNETFSPDLKPAPSSYAQMLPSGLVVWMTPRPGFPKPVPTSVIGYVRGLGMLVHNWEDNKHYFITDSGSWLADQR